MPMHTALSRLTAGHAVSPVRRHTTAEVPRISDAGASARLARGAVPRAGAGHMRRHTHTAATLDGIADAAVPLSTPPPASGTMDDGTQVGLETQQRWSRAELSHMQSLLQRSLDANLPQDQDW
eukprot:347384-Chlamydomonas_euryale.AAC.1